MSLLTRLPLKRVLESKFDSIDFAELFPVDSELLNIKNFRLQPVG